MSSAYIEAKLTAGTHITKDGVTDLVRLANTLGCGVHCKANDITLLVHPGDDPMDLAACWDDESSKKDGIKIAVAWRGREIRAKAFTATKREV